jgi:hypothetical protein
LLYQDFAEIFIEKNNEKAPLPPHRPYDMEIILDPSKPPLPPSPKVYSLPISQEKVLNEYIDRALTKGWIRPSKSVTITRADSQAMSELAATYR